MLYRVVIDPCILPLPPGPIYRHLPADSDPFAAARVDLSDSGSSSILTLIPGNENVTVALEVNIHIKIPK